MIPVLITNAMEDKPLPIYGDGMNVREWIFADEHSRAVLIALEHGVPGEVYNIGSGHEKTNLEVVREILRLLGKPESLIQFVKDRPGHDQRYAMDARKIEAELGWKPREKFETGLRRTVEWYLAHMDWVGGVSSGAYRNWLDLNYGQRGRA